MTSRQQGISCPACEVHKTEWRAAERYCAVAMHEELEDECAVPLFKKEETYDPPMASSEFQDVLAEYKSVFFHQPRKYVSDAAQYSNKWVSSSSCAT